MNHHLKMLLNINLVRHFSSNGNKKGNHYDSLGITPKATQGDVKNAYYKLSKEYHPDTNRGSVSAAEKFRDIAEAYEVLGNLKARKLYDRGILMGHDLRDDSQSTKPAKEKYEHAPFYHSRNKPLSTKATVSGKSRYYDMDEWTKGHYSETFAKSRSKKHEGQMHVTEKLKTKKENILIVQFIGLIMVFMACGFIYGTDPTRKFDEVSLNPIKEEKPD